MTTAAKGSENARMLASLIRKLAAEEGFDICRITAPTGMEKAAENLRSYLGRSSHGTMEWMAETADRRSDPQALWPEVRSIVMLGMNYGPESDPRDDLCHPSSGNISVYARNRDYHDIIKGKLKQIATKFAVRSGADLKVFVDTAPVMEKPLAAKAGLGWQGKHTNLVSREFGSWLFLGSIFTASLLEPDESEIDHCGSCRACLDACPTAAFPVPYQIDARRCISYLTIEHKGPVPEEFRVLMGNRIYGCDDCLAACPWNKFARATSEIKLKARHDLDRPPLSSLLELDDARFRAFFSGSPVKRIGRNRFVRNCLIAAGNSGDPSLVPTVRACLGDEAPEVRAMSIWALSRLGALGKPDLEYKYKENDPVVLAEWERTEFQP